MKDDLMYYRGTRGELCRFIPQQYSNVLEVGCGRGGFRMNLKPEAEVWGIEPVTEIAESAKKVLDNVLVGTFEQVEQFLPDRYFDLVICNDVIEHMADDEGFLNRIQAKMKPGAIIMGSVPNIRHWPTLRALVFKREFNYKDSGVLDRTHLRFYTINSFPALLRRTGLAITAFEGINRMPHGWTQRLIRISRINFLSDLVYPQFAFVAKVSDA